MSTTRTHRGTVPAPPGTPARPAVVRLALQLRDVAADLPWFAVAPLLRHWHRTWGATPAEVTADMPGDDLLPHAQYRSTRAITVSAGPHEVWPWLVQVGCGRAGWYANDLLDNFGRPSSRVIIPELQHIEVGQWLPMTLRPSRRRSFLVDGFAAPRWLVWTTPIRTWSWRLVALPDGRTRLISRLRTVYDWRRPGTLLTVLLMELADFSMMRRMLHGIRDRAERTTTQPPRPASPDVYPQRGDRPSLGRGGEDSP